MTIPGVCILSLVLVGSAAAQSRATPPAEPVGFSVPHPRALAFSTDEGTWMSVDVAPDGRTIVFDLLGDLYTLSITGGRARRLTEGPAFDAQPRFAPDGRSIAFVSDRGGADALWLVDADGGQPRRLAAGAHLSPAWSPDGRCVAASKAGSTGPTSKAGPTGPASKRGRASPSDVMLYCRDGDEPSRTLGTGLGPTFSPDGRYVYFIPASNDWFGSNLRLTVYDRRDGHTGSIPAGPRPVVSPDGKSLVFAVPYKAQSALKIRDLTTGAERWLALGLPPLNATDPSRDALPGYAFTPDGTALIISLGTKLWRIEVASGKRTPVPFTAEVRQALGALVHVDGASPDAVAAASRTRAATKPEPARQAVAAPFPRDVARGTIMLRGARLLTMRGHEVLERGDVVITDGRIAAVGTNLPVPAGAHVVEVAGKTILPGYVDLWTNFRLLPGGHALQPWEFLAHLAYGVTTVRATGATNAEVFDSADRVEAGEPLGPRYFAAGVESSLLELEPTVATDRAARQRVLLTAGRRSQPVLASAGGNWTRSLTLLQDGFPVSLGTIPVTPLGADVVQLVARSGATYLPGLVKNDGARWPLDRFIAEGRYHDDPKLQRFIPHAILDEETLSRKNWATGEHYRFRSYAADAARIVAAGGRVAVATRGAFPGLGMHWELWALHATGSGLAVYDALRAGTIWGAEALGVARALGSLEPGKLADLQVVDGNPLEDIRRTMALTYVMKDGRLYEAATLAEVWPRPRVPSAPWWLDRDPVRPMTEPTLSALARAGTQGTPSRPPTSPRSEAGPGGLRTFTVTPIARPRPQDPTYALPLVPTRTARFTTDEGTSMSVDVSPDGRTLLFDLLGDLYTVPVTGGRATRLMGGLALDMSPRYSPDGQRIVFVSDRSGQDNLWLVEADGRHPRPLGPLNTNHERIGRHVEPTWTPDGRFIIAAGSWHDVATGATAERLKTHLHAVAFGGSARYAYGTAQTGQGHLDVYDLTTGQVRMLLRAPRSVCQPAVSRDDRWLAYYTAADGQASLRVRNLQNGEERWLARDVHPELMYCGYPRFAFLPDGRALVVTAGGKLWRIEVPSGKRTLIPFQAEVELDLGPLAQFQYPVSDTFTVRQIREPRLSPDGTRLAFIALDKLYLMDFPRGAPRRATTAAGVVENYPAWSPDGRYVAFSSYSDLAGGHIYRVEAARVLASGPQARPERLTRDLDLYTRLAYTPDGRRLVFGRTPWHQQRHSLNTSALRVDLGWMAAVGGGFNLIAHLTDRWIAVDDAGVPPQFLAAEPDRLVVPFADALVSMRWDGSERRTLLRWPASGLGIRDWTSIPPQAVLSPDGAYALVTYRSQLYLATLPQNPTDSLLLDLSVTPPAVPGRRISRYGAEFPGWSPDGKQFYFALGRSLFVYDRPAGPAPAGDSLRGARHDVKVVVARDRARGILVLRGARLLTMRGDEVITRGDVVIRDGRILAVERSGAVAIPQGARVIDVTGKTILPGYVDLHDHGRPSDVTHKTQVPQYLAQLAYGVTTVRNPQTSTSDFLAYADRVEMGDLLGPHVLGTGPAIGQGRKEPLMSLAAVRDLVRRYGEFYRTQTLKQYAAGSRLVRQWVVMASHELRLSPTTEGGGHVRELLTDMLDGYAGHEHSGGIGPLYRDMVLLAAASGITWDPTLIVQTRSGLIHRERPHDDPKLRRFTPRLDGFTRVGDWNAEGMYRHQSIARSAAAVAAAGGHVGIGAHGELHGLGTHWELWLLGSGGLSNLEVLRAGTLTGARAVGLDRDLGSLEPGKLADLQVLDGNPLEDLRQTTTLRYVMKDGRLYDANTLDELWPRQRKLGPQWWHLDEPPAEMLGAAR